MNFNTHLVVICCILYITNQCLTEECVQRRLGACKVVNKGSAIWPQNFQIPQPEGFVLKTSIEINLLKNKHNFEKNLPVELKRPIGYDLDNAALVKISINMNVGYIEIYLGKKYYRLAELHYSDYATDVSETKSRTKYNRYTPVLPTFPYNLDLEITTNGTFSIYSDANTEPFFEYQLTQDVNAEFIEFEVPGNQTDLIVFADCSVKYKSNCGSHRIDILYGCREWQVEEYGYIKNFEGFEKAYGEGVLFDEFIVVETEYSSVIKFEFRQHNLIIVFKVDSIEAILKTHGQTIKSVRTEQWFEIPASPYAVRVLLTTGENNNFLNISNLRPQEILSLNLCGNVGNKIKRKRKYVGSLQEITFYGGKFYFDCLSSDQLNSTMMNERARKTSEDELVSGYHENGYNYTKTLLDTQDFVSEPFVIYHHEFGDTTEDWCAGEPKPKVPVASKYDNASLQDVLTELKEINAQNKANAANTAVLTSVLTELEKISNTSADANKAIADTNKAVADTNKVLLSVKASIEALAHLEQNFTTLNNQLNVTVFKTKINECKQSMYFQINFLF